MFYTLPLLMLGSPMWWIVFCTGISLTIGQQIFCDKKEICGSDEYDFKTCTVDDDLAIVSVTVDIQLSKSSCIYYEGEPESYNGHDGVYGFKNNSIWVDEGCEALFLICYTVQQIFCDKKEICGSDEYEFERCMIDGDLAIVNVTVDVQLSKSSCLYYEGEPESYNGHDGMYGYNNSSIWVAEGCEALFLICYTETTTSTAPTSTHYSQGIDNTTVVSSPYHQSDTTETTTFTTEEVRNNSRTTERQDDSNEDLIVITVVPIILLLLIISSLGIFFWRKRQKLKEKSGRENSQKKNKDTAETKTNQLDFIITDIPSKECYVESGKNKDADIEQRIDFYSDLLSGETSRRENVQTINENIKFVPKDNSSLPYLKNIAEDCTDIEISNDQKKKHLSKLTSNTDSSVSQVQDKENDDYLVPASSEPNDYIELIRDDDVYDRDSIKINESVLEESADANKSLNPVSGDKSGLLCTKQKAHDKEDDIVKNAQTTKDLKNSLIHVNANVNTGQEKETNYYLTPVSNRSNNYVDLISCNEINESAKTVRTKNVQKGTNEDIISISEDDHIYDEVIPYDKSEANRMNNKQQQPERIETRQSRL